MTTENIDFINRYNDWLLDAFTKDDATYRAGLLDWITEDTVLLEPKSIPWGGKMVGTDGWVQLRANAAATGESTGAAMPEFKTLGQWDTGDGTVFHELEVTMQPSATNPNPEIFKIMEKYTIENNRITRIEEFYDDSASVLLHLGWKLVAPE